MPTRLKTIQIKNYRSLADVSLALEPVNVLFGPNGAGKSTLLDTIWFVRDCAIRSVELASTNRDHGIGLLFDGADEGDSIRLKLATDQIEYELILNLSAGRIEPFAGERLFSLERDRVLFERRAGTSKAEFFHIRLDQAGTFDLREPEKISLGRYLDYRAELRRSDRAGSNPSFRPLLPFAILEPVGSQGARFDHRISRLGSEDGATTSGRSCETSRVADSSTIDTPRS